MLCEKCKQREATVHKQAIINGVAHSEHLCAECAAKERGSWNPFASFFDDAFFTQPFSGFSNFANFFAPFFQVGGQTLPQEQEAAISPCPHCGMTWDEFQQNGFLGCSECYDHFKDAMPPLMQNLHCGDAGQAAAESEAAESAPMSAKEHLQAEMARAIEAENFEEAARLRDAIKALEAAENDGPQA